MKGFVVVVAMVAQLMLTGTVLAVPIQVDFGALAGSTVDITAQTNPAGLPLNGLTFRYDNFRSRDDFAIADSAGIFGSTFGRLIVDFGAPATYFSFDFALLGAGGPVVDGVAIGLKRGGYPVGDLLASAAYDPATGEAAGAFGYSGFSFDQAELVFSPNAFFFSLTNPAYSPVPEDPSGPVEDMAPVPEPGTLLLLGSALPCLGLWRRFVSRA